MLEIHEKKNTDGYENIIQNIDCQYLHIVESINGDSVNGYGIYSVDENGVTIYDFDSSDMNAMLSGINECIFEIKDENKIHNLTKLGFVMEHEQCINDISNFMINCKKCKELQ